MELNFGKFKGWEIDDIPTSYLAFLLEATYVTDEIKNECLAEINYRFGYENDTSISINKNLVNSIYKKLTLKHHPDKGGHHYAMVALNEFRESLLNEI